MPIRIPTPLLNLRISFRSHFFGKRSIPRVPSGPGAAQIHGNRATAPDIDQGGTHRSAYARTRCRRVHGVFHALVRQRSLEFISPAIGRRSRVLRNGSSCHSNQLRTGTDCCRGQQRAYPLSEVNQRSSPCGNTLARRSIRLFGGRKQKLGPETHLDPVKTFPKRESGVVVKPLSGSSGRHLKRTLRLTDEETVLGDSRDSCI